MMPVFFKKYPLSSVMHQSKRQLWAYLNIIFNLVDEKRIKEIGPDRACAEWLMRNGSAVTFDGTESTKDYNLFASLDPSTRMRLVEVDASEASITHHGFKHFMNCNYIRSVKMHKCWYINDRAVDQLAYVQDTLLKLHISSCDEVTDAGVKSIGNLRKLTHLKLHDLRVKDWKSCEETLRKSLPNCDMALN